MTQAELWEIVRRALRTYNEARNEEQKFRAFQMLVRAMEKYRAHEENTTESFGSRANLS